MLTLLSDLWLGSRWELTEKLFLNFIYLFRKVGKIYREFCIRHWPEMACNFTQSHGKIKGIPTPSGSISVSGKHHTMLVYDDAWEWVWDRFSSVTIDQHCMMLDAAAAARCEYS